MVSAVSFPRFSRTLKAFSKPDVAYCAGRFLLATLGNDAPSAQWCREKGIDTNFYGAQSETDNSSGGFLVPSELEDAVIVLREKYGTFRKNARVVPMNGDVKNISRRTGGLTCYYGGDAATMTASQMSWDLVSLIAKKLYCLTRFSSELNDDSIISIADTLADEMAFAFAKAEDLAGFTGDGTSTYGGIVGVLNALNAGSVVTANSGDVGFDTLNIQSFLGCIAKLPTYALKNAKWYVSNVGWSAAMLRLLLGYASGNKTIDVANGATPDKFLGFPVVISNALNSTLGSQPSTPLLLFGDCESAATFGDRRGISLLVSDQYYLATDEIGVRATERYDINIHERGTSTTPGALLVLNSAAS